jgi:hypothetical protein
MKNIIFIIIILSLPLLIIQSIYGQQTRQVISNITAVSLPADTRKITSDEVKALSFGNQSNFVNPNRIIYKVDGMLVGFADKRQSIKSDMLNEMKSSLEYTFSGTDLNCKSESKVVNGNSVLIITYVYKNVLHYNYFAVNGSRTAMSNGMIEAIPTDSAKARALLDSLIASLVIN